MGLVQSWKNTASTATPSAAVGSSSVTITTGNRLILYMSNSTSSGGAPTPTKTAGTATISVFTTLLQNSGVHGADTTYCTLWSATVTTGGTCTLSATNNSATNSELGWTAEEWSGMDGSAGTGCLDVTATGTYENNNTTNPPTGTTAATHAANQFALCMVADWGGTATWTLATANGFTKNSGASLDADANAGIAVANKVSASGATENAVWTCGITNIDMALVAVIKAGAGVAAGVPDVVMAQMGGN